MILDFELFLITVVVVDIYVDIQQGAGYRYNLGEQDQGEVGEFSDRWREVVVEYQRHGYYYERKPEKLFHVIDVEFHVANLGDLCV